MYRVVEMFTGGRCVWEGDGDCWRVWVRWDSGGVEVGGDWFLRPQVVWEWQRYRRVENYETYEELVAGYPELPFVLMEV